MVDTERLSQLWKSRKIALEMLTDRGYDVEEYALELPDFLEWAGTDSIIDVKEAMSIVMEKKNEKTLLTWCTDPKLGTKIKNVILELNEAEASRAIVIVDICATPATKSIIADMRINKVYIEWYSVQSMQFNVTKHYLVPKHVLCTKKEVARLYKMYNIKGKGTMPHIEASDAIMRYYGAIKGQVYKINRRSHTQPGQLSLTYRVVI